MPTTDRGFDTRAFKRRVQGEIYEQIKDLTPQQQIEYFRCAAETGPLGSWWRRVCRPDHDIRDDQGADDDAPTA